MPIITAFQGTITVDGYDQSDYNKLLYKKTVTAYGATIGELLDNLVEASVPVANDLFAWLVANKPEGYKLSDDLWSCQIIFPEILESAAATPSNLSKVKDIGNGSSLPSVEYFVQFCTLVRDIQTKVVINHLLLTQTGEKSQIVDEEAASIKGMYNVTSFSEITKFGFSGKELDKALEIGLKEGRVQKGLESKRFARNMSANIKAEPEKKKKSWWDRKKTA